MDHRLIQRAQHGDHDAYAQVATLSSNRLYSVALRILRDPDEARDALQAALISIWRDLPTLRDPSLFEAWSYRVVYHACGDVRRKAKRVTVSIDVLGLDTPVSDSQSTIAMRDELERAFQKLSVDQRTVVVLHYYRDLSIPEIGAALGISEGTVKSRLHSSRQAMRAAIDAGTRRPVPQERPA